MMPRKKRVTVMLISFALAIFVIIGLLVVLYLNTDFLKSSEYLFAKYVTQNVDAMRIINTDNDLDIRSVLDDNMYESNLKATIKYTENIGTSNENKDNAINKMNLIVKSNIDKSNNYKYRDISINSSEEVLMRAEYINDNEDTAIRLNGIKQFVVDNEGQVIPEINNLDDVSTYVNILSALEFSEEEKQQLLNKYLKTLQENVSKDKYGKLANSVITLNNKDISTNAYYIRMNIEEYNNLYIKLLEEIKQDEIVLNKFEIIDNKIKELYSEYSTDKSLKENFINQIEKKVDQIKSNNIGNDEVKITVYVNNNKTVRTSIEKNTNKFIIDLYDDNFVRVSSTEIGESTNEESLNIEKNENAITVNYRKIEDNQLKNDLQFEYDVVQNGEYVNKNINITISNEKYEAVLNIVDDIEIVNSFEEQVTLETDTVRMQDLTEEQKESVKSILKDRIEEQLSDLYSVFNLQNGMKILNNLGIIDNNLVPIPEQGEVTEIEKQRFNGQFEFFNTTDLTSSNIEDLLDVAKSNLDSIKFLLKNGEIEDLDVQNFSDTNKNAMDYINNVDEILILIKENSKNDSNLEDIMKFIEKTKDNIYDVSIQYDSDGLTRLIRAKIQEKN